MPKKTPAKPKATTKRTKSVPKAAAPIEPSVEMAMASDDRDGQPADRFPGKQPATPSEPEVKESEPAKTRTEPAPAFTPPPADEDRPNNTGDNRDSSGTGDSPAVSDIASELSSRVSRLPGEGRSGCHERLRRLARAAGLPRGQGPGTAYNWAFEQTDRLFALLDSPEPEPPEAVADPPADPGPLFQQLEERVAVSPAPPADDQGVSGLGSLPEDWPALPANAQLQVEIAWVTANRLRVRSGTGVDLSKAISPAPSYSALSWLETSILFPAKFADISVKATAQQDDEKEFIKREKLAIEEIRSILAEMLEAGDV